MNWKKNLTIEKKISLIVNTLNSSTWLICFCIKKIISNYSFAKSRSYTVHKQLAISSGNLLLIIHLHSRLAISHRGSSRGQNQPISKPKKKCAQFSAGPTKRADWSKTCARVRSDLARIRTKLAVQLSRQNANVTSFFADWTFGALSIAHTTTSWNVNGSSFHWSFTRGQVCHTKVLHLFEKVRE